MKLTHGSKPDTQSTCREYRERLQRAHGNVALETKVIEQMGDEAFAIVPFEPNGIVIDGRNAVYVFMDRSWLAVKR